MSAETPAAFQADNYEIAEAIAPTWERRREDIERACAQVRDWMLKELRPSEGDTVLELAAGVGETGLQAAAALGERGRLITTDLSPAMLAAARRRGDELGVENVTYEVMDAEHLPLETDSVDGVLCRFGYMLMEDQAAALAETRRVLRSGGRLALACWGPPERNPFFGLIGMSLGQRGHIPPLEPPPAPGPFSMASPERTTALLEGAGFSERPHRGGPCSLRRAGRGRVPEPARRHRRPDRARAAGAARVRARRGQDGRRGRIPTRSRSRIATSFRVLRSARWRADSRGRRIGDA